MSTLVSVRLLGGATPADAGVDQQTRSPAHPQAPFTALVPEGVHLGARFVELAQTHLTQAPGDTCLYTDFSVAGSPVQVGDWSVERSRWQDYTGPVLVVPTSALADFSDPATDAESARRRLACLRAASEVRHIPQTLYQATIDPVTDLTLAERQQLTVDLPYQLDASGRRRLPELPSVSVIIPTRLSRGRIDGHDGVFLDHCLDTAAIALERLTAQVIIVLDEDVDPAPLRRWQDRWPDRFVVVTTPGPFNFSVKINAGVAVADGEFVVMLNDDVAAMDDTWLDELIAVASEPDVGAVAPLLLFEDGAVQHRGHAFSAAGVHLADAGRPAADPGPRRRNQSDRDVTGVTGACLVQRRAVWSQVGGLDPDFPVAFNDVDYCERIRSDGLRIVLCNSVRLHHYESRTRRGTAQQWEVDLLARRWPESWGRPDPLTPGATPATAPPRWRQWLDRLGQR